MTTIRRTIVILILLAICFFIYRGVNPQGADRLLAQVRVLPDRFLWTGNILSPYLTQTWTLVTYQTGTKLSVLASWTQKTWWVSVKVSTWIVKKPLPISGVFVSQSYFSGFLAWLDTGNIFPDIVSSGWLLPDQLALSRSLFSWIDPLPSSSPTGGKLTIVPSSSQQISPWNLPLTSSWASQVPPAVVQVVVNKPTSSSSLSMVKSPSVVTSKPSSSSRLSQQELRDTQALLNHLFH